MRKRCWKTVLSAILASAMLFTSVPTNLTMTVHAEELGMEDMSDDVSETEVEDEQENQSLTGNEAGGEQNVQNPVGGTKAVKTTEDDGAETEAPDTNDSNAGNSGSQNATKATGATTGEVVNGKQVTFTCVAADLTFTVWDSTNETNIPVQPDENNPIVVLGGKVNADWTKLATLTNTVDDVWEGTATLSPGSYNYKFVVGEGGYETGDNRPFSIDGMSDATINVVRGEETDLADKIDGISVVYALTSETTSADTNGAISLSGEPGSQKLTVGADWEAGKDFTMTATQVDGSETCTVTVKVTATALKEDPTITGPVTKNGRTTFYYFDTTAEEVYLAGSMTDWQNGKKLMTYHADTGYWTITLTLGIGTHKYKFIVDGSWITDPLNPPPEGGDGNSEVTVTEAPSEVSPIIEDKTVTFMYENSDATAVYVAGTMSGWGDTVKSDDYKMSMNEDSGYWELTKEMSAGSYEYKYVYYVEGDTELKWAEDPLNPNKIEGGNATFVIAGLADDDVVMNRARAEVELTSTLNLFDEAGKSSEVAVTYDLSEETKKAPYKDAVKVTTDEESGKSYVTITDKFPEDVTEFTLTASDKDGNASKVTVTIVDKTYKYTIYYYDRYPSHMDVEAADLWIWENTTGGSAGAAFEYTEKVTLNDSDEWLKATVEVPYTELGIIGRSKGGWTWQDENRSYSNPDEDEEVTLYYVFGRDLTKTYPTKLPAPVTEPDPRFLVVEYTRGAGTDDWYFYTWNNGRIDKDYIEEQDGSGNSFIPFKDEDGDGTGIAIVPIGPWNESVSFCLEQKAGGAHWADKDGGDHMCTLPLDQTVVKIKMVEGQGITYVYPYNTGYEIDVPEKTIHFYYRDDEAFLKGSESGHASAQLEIRVKDAEGKVGEAETKDMVYDMDDIDDDPEQQRYEYDVEDLQATTYYYRYVLKDDEDATTYVLDKYNEEKETIDGTEYSVCKYELFDVELQASMQNDSMDYNDNNVLTLTVKAKDSEPAQQADEAQAEENKLPVGFEVSKAYVDLSAIGGSSEAEIDPELLQLSIAVKRSVETGTKTLPVTLYDQYNNVYTAEANVNVTPRDKSSHIADDFDWDEAVIYFAVTDRFFDGNAGNNSGNAPGSYDKTTNNGSNSSYHGGDFAGLTQKLDYLQDLGVNTIWITPIVQNQLEANVVKDDPAITQAWGYHGYWAKDFTKLDEHLGTEAEFSALLDAAHAKGMKVMVDVVLNHSGYGDAVTDYFNNYETEDGEVIQMLRGADETVSGSDQQSSLSGLPDFRTEDPEVRNLLVEWQSNWISKYNIDYYRVDTVKHVDNTTWSAFKNALTEINPDFKMIGEWAGAGYGTDTGLLNSGRMDSLLDFDFNDQAATFVKGDLSSVENFLSARNGAIDNTASLGAFLSSHDEDGFVYKLMNPEQGVGKSKEEAHNLALVAASLQLTAKGQVVIYYGEEIGVSDGQENYPYNTNRNDFDWSKVTDDNKTLAHYKTMLAIRNKYSDVLAKGSRTTVVADNERGLDVFTRSYGGTSLIVALNIRDAAQEYVLVGQNPGATFYDNYSGTQYVADKNGNVIITVPAVADGGTVVLEAGQGAQGELNVPATMQVKSIPNQTYTGLSIKLSEDVLQVSHGTTRLVAGVDYSVSYKNNKAIGTATVTIKGKGNYKDTVTTQFNIVPKNIEDEDVEITYNEFVRVNNKEQKPLSKITYNGKKLTTKDYKVEYYKFENDQKIGSALKGVKEVGNYQMVITGMGNYTGTFTDTIHVVADGDGTFMNTLNITLKYNDAPLTSIAYTGTAIEPTVEVKKKDGTLVDEENYKVSSSNNTNVGTANVVITGLSAKGYYGSVTKTFKITGTALSSVAKINTTGWQNKVPINPLSGEAVQTNASLTPKRDDTLEEGTDYTVSYSNNTKPGTATVTFTGMGRYTGSLKKTFKVTAVAWSKADLGKTLSVTVSKTASFAKKGAQPTVNVTYNNKRLTAGKDYKVTYNNNKAVTTTATKKKPSVTITGMGMFSGTIKDAKDFTIVPADLKTAGITVTVPDAELAGNIESKPVVKEADGTYLTNGTDYTVEYHKLDENGKPTEDNDTPTVNTRMQVTVTGKGNYEGSVSKEYRIVGTSISKATIVVKAQTYTGQAITLDANDFSKARIGKNNLKFGEDFEIVPGSYENNVNKGNATVIVRGIGENYGGEKKVTFRITSSGMRWWWNLFS